MELSRDKIKEIINDDWLLMDDCEGNKNCDVVKELARIALASLEAEAVAVRARWKDEGSGHGNWKYYDIAHRDSLMADENRECELIYTAPPVPVSVPDLKGLDEFIFNLVSAMASEELSHNEKELFSIASKYISYARERFSSAMLLGSEPDFREISNSSTNNFRENAETSTKCWCHICRPVKISDMRFVVCPDCGNKRCPHANDHRNACTGSNEPGQEGSAYPAAPQQEVAQALAKGMERYGDAMQELAKKEVK